MEEDMKKDIKDLIEYILELSEFTEVDLGWVGNMAEKYGVDN